MRDVLQNFLSVLVNDGRIHTTAFTLNHASNPSFVLRVELSTFPASSADQGFVHFHRPRTLQLQILRQQHSDLPEHAPRGFIGDASLTLDLLCRDSATSGSHQVHGLKPDAKRSSALLKNGSREWVDMMAATVASISSASGDTVMLAFLFAGL